MHRFTKYTSCLPKNVNKFVLFNVWISYVRNGYFVKIFSMAPFSWFYYFYYFLFGWKNYLEVNLASASSSQHSLIYLLLCFFATLAGISGESNQSSPIVHLSLYFCNLKQLNLLLSILFWFLLSETPSCIFG